MLRHRVPGLRSTAVLLACALTAGSATAIAAPKAPKTPAGTDDAAAEDPLANAQSLYDKGRAKFETADYRAAIELWSEAYAQVPDTADGGQIKVLLIYNIATARERAFEVTQDPAELRQARILLTDFERSIPALYGEGQEAETERQRVRAKIAEIDAELEQLDQDEPEPDPDPDDGTETQPEPEPEPEPGIDDPQPEPAAKGLVIGGAASLGLGVAGLGMMGAGLAIGNGANDISELDPNDIDARRDQFDRGRTGNTLAIAGGITAGVLVVTGSVLLALGMRRKKASAVALAPGVGPTGAGLSLRGRF